MKRLIFATVVAVLGTAAFAPLGMAAPPPGTYKGNIYAGAKKGAAATVKVAGTKVTIKVAKFPCKRQGPSGKFDTVAPPSLFEYKGTLKGNSVNGMYVDPLGGTGEYTTAKLTYSAATKSFTGKISRVGYCRGTSTLKAKKS